MSDPPSNHGRQQWGVNKRQIKTRTAWKLCHCFECNGKVTLKPRFWLSHQKRESRSKISKKQRRRTSSESIPFSNKRARSATAAVEDSNDNVELDENDYELGDLGTQAPVPVPIASAERKTRKVDEKLVFANGRLRRGTILDLLVEHASVHNISREAMQGIVDIINLLALDGGADAPILPSYAAFDKALVRAGKGVVEKYLICAHECDSGCMPYNTKDALPNFCSACGKKMELEKGEVDEFLLRHFNVAKYLDIILSHPGVQLSALINNHKCDDAS